MNQWAFILTAAILGSGAAIARASEPEAASPAESNVRGAPSPNIGADRTIHFSLKAPEATSVQVAVGSLGHWTWSGTQTVTAGDLHAVRLGCLQRGVDGAVRSDVGAGSASYIRLRRGCGLRFTRPGGRCPRA